MRVNIDDKALTDPRITFAAARLGIERPAFLGRCIPVWMAAYQCRSPIMSKRNVDALAQLPGFVEAMLAEDLATAIDDDLVSVRLRGVTERIEFLEIQDAKREKANAAKRAKAGLPGARPTGPPPATSPGNIPGQGPYSLALTPTLTPTHAPDQSQAHAHDRSARGARAPKALDPESVRLARLLRDLIQRESPHTKIAKLSSEASEEWVLKHAPELELLHRKDGIAWGDIEKAITFATADSFWSANVQSGKKLREKYDTLITQMRRGPAKSPAKAPDFTRTDYTAIPEWMKGAS